MPKFVVRRVDSIISIKIVSQLVVEGIEPLASFEDELKGTTYRTELDSAMAYLQHLANGGTMTEQKFKYLKGETAGGKEFELRSKHLRIYGIMNGYILILGGYKKNQDPDLIKLRNIKKRYLDSLKK